MRLPAFLKNKSARKRVVIALIIISIIIGIRVFGIGHYITFEDIKRNRDYLRGLVDERYMLFVIGYIIAYILIASFAVPLVSEPLSLAGGFLFGALPSAIYINIGATTGASIAFLFSRYLFRDWVQQKFQARLAHFNREVEKNGYRYLLSLRLMPLVSFVLVDVLAEDVRLDDFRRDIPGLINLFLCRDTYSLYSIAKGHILAPCIDGPGHPGTYALTARNL